MDCPSPKGEFMARRRLAGMVVLGLSASLIGIGPVTAQQIHRNGFETMRMGWLKGGFDAPFEEKAHAISDQVAHDGRHSEYLQFDAKSGTFIHYAYPTGKAIVGEELSAGIWLKSNRPGMQIMARVVLPRERDPQNLDLLLTTYIRGDVYQQIGQWQHLQLTRPVQLAKQQQQLMQAQQKRAFDFTGAYLDGLVLNVYGGPGRTDVWIDDVEAGPIVATDPFRPAVTAPGPTPAQPVKVPTPRGDAKSTLPEFSGDRLKVGGKPFFPRGIYVSDTPLEKLQRARFNTLMLESTANASLIREASDRGLWVVPLLHLFGSDGKLMPSTELAKDVAHFSEADVIFTQLGNTLAYEQAKLVERGVEVLKELDPGRIPSADVWDGLAPYARSLSLVGAHRWPLMTTLELPRYREWLRARPDLANRPNVFLWTTIQTHMPEALAQALYNRSADGSFDEPVGPQAEHIQLLTYTALAAGCRGLVFSSDRFLADSHQGRDRLLTCALLNLELEMLEPLIAGSDALPEWLDTSSPDVKAAVIRSPQGVLVLPMWQGPFSQYVPGQSAVGKLSVTVPAMAQSMQAWEVSPADVRHLKIERVVGGTKVTLLDFGLTGAIVFTSNTELVARFQEQAKGRRKLASEWARDLAAYELDKVVAIQDQLERQGHTLPDARNLVEDAKRRLTLSTQAWEKRAFPEAYRNAQQALRPMRILMRAQWEKAVRGMDSPVASPYAASFFTLPRHWPFMDQVRRSTAAKNVLPGGDFEAVSQQPEEAWHPEIPTSLDDVKTIAERVGSVMEPEFKTDTGPKKDDPSDPKKDGEQSKKTGQPENKKTEPGRAAQTAGGPNATPIVTGLKKVPPHEGKQCAMLKIEPKPMRAAPAALERTVVALSSPVVRLAPGTLVQVSGWVCIPSAITASPDGALLYDSTGGDAMALRLTDPMPWKKFTVYRRIPASGTIQVTLALTGLGTVYFDDIRIEPLVER
jgi:hypothetical protein